MVLEELPMILLGILKTYWGGIYVGCRYLFGVLVEVLKPLKENGVLACAWKVLEAMLGEFQVDSRKFLASFQRSLNGLGYYWKFWGYLQVGRDPEELPWMQFKVLLKNSVDFVGVWWSFRLWRELFNGFQAFSGWSFMGLGFQVLSYGDLSGAPCRGLENSVNSMGY